MKSDNQEILLYNSDSVIQSQLEEKPTSLFEGHALSHNDSLLEKPIVSQQPAFGISVIVLCVAVIGYVQKNSDGFILSIFRLAFDSNLTLQDSRIDNFKKGRNNQILQIVAFISVALFIATVCFKTLNYDYPLTQFFIEISGLLLIAYWGKRIAIWALGLLFEVQQEAKFYRYNMNLFFSIDGLLLLPLSLLMLFSPQIPINILIALGAITVSFFYLKTLHRGLIGATNGSGIKLLHLFYYLCGLEILPLCLMVRFVQTL
ncbi:DUF4271 domain-containing protein [Bacteroidota bacterium]